MATARFDPPLRFAWPLLPDYSRVCGLLKPQWSEGSVTKGPLTAAYEKAAARALGVANAVAVSSCTTGLIMALRALNLEGECLLPSFTFTSTAQAVLWNGLKPVFADCNPTRFTVTAETLEAALTPRTTAVIATYIFGNPPPLDEIEAFCRAKKLKLVLDAAHAFGTFYRGKPAGARGECEVFSSSATKLLCTGEGGLISTRSDALAETFRTIREYGHDHGYETRTGGLNGRITEFQGAMGIEGLPLLEEHAARRNALAAHYRKAFADLPVSFQEIEPGCRSSYKDFAVLLEGEWSANRDRVAAALEKEGVPTRKYFFPPSHAQKFFAERAGKCESLHATEKIANRILCFPIYYHLKESDIDRIAEILAGIRVAVS